VYDLLFDRELHEYTSLHSARALVKYLIIDTAIFCILNFLIHNRLRVAAIESVSPDPVV